MHMDNKFGKISRISACAALKDGKTILEELSFTAPYKSWCLLRERTAAFRSCLSVPPPESWQVILRIFLPCKRRGRPGSTVTVLWKIHKMDEGAASRTIEVQVDKNATLYYYPQPVIPFAQSSLTAEWRFIWKTKPPACSCWKLFPVAEKHIMNVFGIADFPQKSFCTEMINWFTATTPATSLTECRWKG